MNKMKRIQRIIFFILVFHLFISCERKPDYLELNKSYDLSFGKCIHDFDKILCVCFDSLITDSRCPEGGICFWAGEAIARFKITVGKYEIQAIDLKLSNDTVIHGFKFSFVGLSPYPSIRHTIRLNDYEARIIVQQE